MPIESNQLSPLTPEESKQIASDKQDPIQDLGQSQYNFNYLVFPNNLGMEDSAHYVIININVPTTLNGGTRSNYTSQYTQLGDRSKVDKLRYGSTGSLTPFFDVNLTSSSNRNLVTLPRRTRRIAESIALHMPTPLIYNTQNAYEEISLSALAGRIGSTGLGFLFAAGGVNFRSITNALARSADFRKLADGAGNIFSAGNKLLQQPINPAVEILFANTLVRSFSLEFMMAPRNEQESINMKSIIKTLRFHAAPEIGGGGGLFWIPPAEFDISFYHRGVENTHILRINTCVLERIEVDYSPTGIYSTFTNGHPVAARLSLGLRELEPVHKQRVLQGF